MREESVTATDSLEAALRAGMKRLSLHSGVSASYDGAYDWVKPGSTDPDDAPGDHPSDWPGEGYHVVEVGEPDALAAAVRKWLRRRVPPRALSGLARESDEYNRALADVARRLGL